MGGWEGGREAGWVGGREGDRGRERDYYSDINMMRYDINIQSLLKEPTWCF